MVGWGGVRVDGDPFDETARSSLGRVGEGDFPLAARGDRSAFPFRAYAPAGSLHLPNDERLIALIRETEHDRNFSSLFRDRAEIVLPHVERDHGPLPPEYSGEP